jgi:ABC-type sugar transport system ATPase subunit
LNIKFADYRQKIIYLSGGNQQKVIIGRTLVTDCEVFILLEPTRGWIIEVVPQPLIRLSHTTDCAFYT